MEKGRIWFAATLLAVAFLGGVSAGAAPATASVAVGNGTTADIVVEGISIPRGRRYVFTVPAQEAGTLSGAGAYPALYPGTTYVMQVKQWSPSSVATGDGERKTVLPMPASAPVLPSVGTEAGAAFRPSKLPVLPSMGSGVGIAPAASSASPALEGAFHRTEQALERVRFLQILVDATTHGCVEIPAPKELRLDDVVKLESFRLYFRPEEHRYAVSAMGTAAGKPLDLTLSYVGDVLALSGKPLPAGSSYGANLGTLTCDKLANSFLNPSRGGLFAMDEVDFYQLFEFFRKNGIEENRRFVRLAFEIVRDTWVELWRGVVRNGTQTMSRGVETLGPVSQDVQTLTLSLDGPALQKTLSDVGRYLCGNASFREYLGIASRSLLDDMGPFSSGQEFSDMLLDLASTGFSELWDGVDLSEYSLSMDFHVSQTNGQVVGARFRFEAEGAVAEFDVLVGPDWGHPENIQVRLISREPWQDEEDVVFSAGFRAESAGMGRTRLCVDMQEDGETESLCTMVWDEATHALRVETEDDSQVFFLVERTAFPNIPPLVDVFQMSTGSFNKLLFSLSDFLE